MATKSVRARTTARWIGGGMLLSVGVLAGISWGLRRADVRFVMYEALPWPGAPWVAVSLICVGLALVLSLPTVWRAVLAGVGYFAIVLAVAWLGIASFSGLGRGQENASYPAPQAPYRLVVHSVGFFEPIYFLSIEQQTGMAARSWYLGCLDGEYDGIEKAGWTGPGVFEMATSASGHPTQIRVDPATGEPIRPGQIVNGCDYKP